MKKQGIEKIWDIIVIGGGPSGMMAAGRAGNLGKSVLLLEKNDHLGKKLLITGGGRCNLTNGEMDTRTFLSHFKENDKFLFSPFAQFGVKETLDFFHSYNMKTKMEDRKRIFPESDSAQSVLDVCLKYLKEGNVIVRLKSEVKKIHAKKGTIEQVELTDGTIFKAHAFILATGGTSRPETGSTGDGFAWLKQLGHTVVPPIDSLVPLTIKEDYVKRLQGITIPEAKITVYRDGIKQNIIKKETSALRKAGRILFTHFGITGPLVLNISGAINTLLSEGKVTLHLDLIPHFPQDILNKKLQELFKQENRKKIKNSLSEFGVSNLIQEILLLAEIDANTINHHITREMRLRLINIMKNFPMTVTGLLGADKAIVTSGGVILSEINPKTMQSNMYKNMFLVGDTLHIDRPSGGFSLQLCWTTGFVAGTSATQIQ